MENMIKAIAAIPGALAAPHKPTKETLDSVESELHFKFGRMLRRYLEEFGLIMFYGVEFLGVTENLKDRSGLVKTTKSLRQDYPSLDRFVVIENLDEGMYVLCDENDNVYRFYEGEGSAPERIDVNVLQYILSQGQESTQKQR